jgi:hypothetical protein
MKKTLFFTLLFSYLFTIYAQTNKLPEKIPCRIIDNPKSAIMFMSDINIKGVNKLRLKVLNGGDNIDYDHGDGGIAKVIR